MLGRLSATAAVCLWCIAGPVQALGLGDMQVKSGLGQRLTAVIPFDSLTADEAESIRVSLARNDQFEQAGLERSAYLSSLKFEVITDQGAPRIEMRSNEIAREPLIQVLIEARTAGGPRVLRQYTVFLDPPAQPVEPTPAPQVVSQPAPSAPPVFNPAPETAAPAPVPAAKPAAAPVWEAAEPAQSAPQAAASEPAASSGPTVHGPIQEGEALWAIANSRKAVGVGQSQAMLAIYEANRSAFLHNNINVLRKGVTLEIPSEEQMRSIGESAARQRLAQLRAPAPVVEAPITADLPLSERVPEPSTTPAITEPASDASEAAEAETPKAATDPTESTVGDLAEEASSADIAGESDSSDASASASAPTVSTAEAEATDEQAGDPASGDKAPWTPPSETEASDTTDAVAEQGEPVAASDVEVDAGELEVELAEEFPLEPEARAPLLGKLWIALIALIALIAALFGISSMRKAREQRAQREYEEALGQAYEGKAPPKSGLAEGAAMAAAAATATASQAHSSDSARAELERMDRALDEDNTEQASETEIDEDITGPYSPDADSGDGILNTSAEVDLGENDPVSEADFHLAYGLYDEAAIMLKRAAEAEPERTDIRVKLAETYFAAGDAQNFAQAAEPLKEELDAKEWGKLAIMGRQLCPGVALFASGDGDDMSVDLSFDDVLSGSSAPGEVDEGLEFKLEELELPTTPSFEETSARESDGNDLEFDLGEFELGGNDQGDQPQVVPDAGEVKAKDFDLSDSDLGGPADNSLDISFDEIDAGLLGDEAQEGGGEESGDGGDAGTKLDLARAYVEMGDSQMARSLLDEVDASGDDEQKKEAAELRGRLSE